MSPRPYRVGDRRRLATAATRERIVAAAREMLADPQASSFTIDAVAERADVARMTVYYQFKSKGKLLEALFDDLGARANMRNLRTAFQEPDRGRGLAILVETFCGLWQSERALLRRLHALAALDVEVDRAMTARGTWRREALAELLGRHGDAPDAELVDVLHVLTSFESYDALAATHAPRTIVRILQRAAETLSDRKR